MITRRSWFVYGTLLAIWVVLLGWQAAEHARVERAARNALLNRTRDISNTLGLLMRSQRFFGVITKERLESALTELVKPGELHPVSVGLFNATNEEVAAAGEPRGELRGGEYWDDQNQTLTVMNLVDLGTNVIMSRNELRPPPRAPETNGPPPSPGLNNAVTGSDQTNAPRRGSFFGSRRRRSAGTNDSFERPVWMKEEEYNAIIQKKGVHSFVIVMSTQSLIPTFNRDLWLRAFIGILATISVAGSGLAWRNLNKTSELQIRLVRTSELNSHLKEMNLAAAGLAHETRNPLNIVRGLAQMISKQEDASPEIRDKSREIIEETDRVTAQLNEFINYSRPREVRRGATDLGSVVAEVVRALNFDVEEKKVQLQFLGEPLVIEADEQLLRQALFNLALNAIQAVPAGGEIRSRGGRLSATEAFIEIADNGPGVAPEHRGEIFKPYFTTNQKGTGLGLAVVQQIVLAHGWEIECLPNHPAGAVFRMNHIRISTKT